jgi:hypothetical protein
MSATKCLSHYLQQVSSHSLPFLLQFENRALKEEVIKLTQALSKIQKDLHAGHISLPANNSSSNNMNAAVQEAAVKAASFSQLMMSQ